MKKSDEHKIQNRLMTGTVSVNITSFTTGGVFPAISDPYCMYRNEDINGDSSYSLGDCQQTIDSFFSAFNTWQNTGMPTGTSNPSAGEVPTPGSTNIYLGGMWDGKFGLKDITPIIDLELPITTPKNSDKSLYADRIATLENLITKANQYIDYIKSLQKSSTYFCTSKCQLQLETLYQSLEGFIAYIGSPKIEANIENHCLVPSTKDDSSLSGGPDSKECSTYLDTLYQNLANYFPYEGLIYFQNELSNGLTLEHFLPSNNMNSFKYVPDKVYEYYPISGNNSLYEPISGTRAYNIYADYQNITSNYLYLPSLSGDFVSIGQNSNPALQNLPTNIYLGNGQPNSALLYPAGSLPINLLSNFKTSYTVNPLFNLDGYFRSSNNMNFENLNLRPNEYFFVMSTLSSGPEGYLLIVGQDYSLTEYAMVNTKYSTFNSLVKIWQEKANDGISNTSRAIRFNTSTGEFKIYDIYSINDSTATMINPANSSVADDGTKRFALKLSSDGSLGIYRAGNSVPIWSNGIDSKTSINNNDISSPNVSKSSFWYSPLFIESPEN